MANKVQYIFRGEPIIEFDPDEPVRAKIGRLGEATDALIIDDDYLALARFFLTMHAIATKQESPDAIKTIEV